MEESVSPGIKATENSWAILGRVKWFIEQQNNRSQGTCNYVQPQQEIKRSAGSKWNTKYYYSIRRGVKSKAKKIEKSIEVMRICSLTPGSMIDRPKRRNDKL
jgi:hypothetical protein